MKPSISLAIIDDHPLIREGVSRSLAETGHFNIVGEGASATDALNLALAYRPDIVLMDISMPGGGLAATAEIRAKLPDQKIVILTVSESSDDLTAALNAGVEGYVLKGVGAKTLADILDMVAGGESYVPPTLAARMLASLKEVSAADADPLSQLSVREREILGLVSGGLSNKEVALRLDLQEKTVKHHMTRILSKLHVRNRTEAALVMRDAGAAPSQTPWRGVSNPSK
jgi:two-component system, NarL family, nitrate/nitrite response regulator NarL